MYAMHLAKPKLNSIFSFEKHSKKSVKTKSLA